MANYATIRETFSSGTRTIPKLGTINLAMRTCPFQPTINAVKDRPRFFGNDAVGNYFGLNGYYGSIPCWLPFTSNYFSCYQASTFFVFAGGLFDTDALLSNPFQFQPKITSQANAFYYGGELAWPYAYGISPTTQQPSTVSMGPGELFLGQSTTNGNFVNKTTVPWQQITFHSVTGPFAATADRESVDLSEHYCANPLNTLGSNGAALPSTLMKDVLLNKYVQGTSTLTGYAPCGTSREVYAYGANTSSGFVQGAFPIRFLGGGPISSPDPLNPIAPYALPQTVTRITGTPFSWFCATTGSYKMHPNSGNFVLAGIAGATPFYGNSLASWDVSTGTMEAFSFGVIALSDPTDNTAFQVSNLNVQQIPGGGFLLWNSSAMNSKMWLIAADFSGYYTINLAGLVGSQTNVSADRIGVDQNGILYFLNYTGLSGGTFVSMQYSGPGTTVIPISLPSLTHLSVACDTFTTEPWAG